MISVATLENQRDKAVEVLDEFISTIQGLQQEIEIRDTLINLIGPDIEWQEDHLTMRSSVRMQRIIDAYRTINPKDGDDDGGNN